ncbi:MAG: porin family protein, partial [Pseudomonadales bacterium]|nr:porin family protein [Pseudomonadales bacterium]
MNKKQLILAAAVATLIAPAVSLAEETGFYVAPSLGFIDYEKDRESDPKIGGELEDDLIWSLGFGYRFDSPWAVEAVYKFGESEILSTFPKTDVEFRALHLDALYHIENDTRLQPYVAFGIGHLDGESDGSPLTKHENNLNAGGGFKYQLNDCIAARSDFRVFRASDDAHIDLVFSLGLQLTLGTRGGQCALVDGDSSGYAAAAAPAEA